MSIFHVGNQCENLDMLAIMKMLHVYLYPRLSISTRISMSSLVITSDSATLACHVLISNNPNAQFAEIEIPVRFL